MPPCERYEVSAVRPHPERITAENCGQLADVSHKDEILDRLARADTERELATEFVKRNHILESERLAPRPIRRLSVHLRLAWLAVADRLWRGETHSERQRV